MDLVHKTSIEPEAGAEPMDFFTSGSHSYMADGPLARAYSDALDVLYKKEMGPDGLALETQQLDADHDQQRWREAQNRQYFERLDLGADVGMLYGVQRQSVRFTNLIAIADAVGRMNPRQRQATAVVLDTTAGLGQHETIALAIEHYCAAHKVPVYTSLAQFLRQHG